MKKMSMYLMALAIISLIPQAFAGNVALGKTVTLNGTFGTDQGGWPFYAPATSSSITDGVIEPEGELWNLNSVWWNGWTNPANNLEINLGGLFKIDGFKVQADDNDSYRVEYKSGASGWLTAYNLPVVHSWGLITRTTSLAMPIYADALRFTATGGDGYYAVSEIQAFGNVAVVSEPAPFILMLTGIAVIGTLRRHKGDA